MTSQITVAIPYHDNPAYLAQAIDSVARQTLAPFELIILDNSPRADAAALLTGLPFKTRHIICPPNLGLASYFNQCLDASQTPFCTILHYDDVLTPDYIETMSDALARHPDACGIICKTYAIDANGKQSFSFKDWGKSFFWPQRSAEVRIHGQDSMQALLRANFIMCPTLCFNLPVLSGMRFDPAWHFMLDLDFFGRLLLQGQSLIGLQKVMYGCRRHPTATTTINEKNFRMLTEGPRCIQSLSDKASHHGWHKAAKTGRHKIVYHGYVAFRVLRNLRPDNIKESCNFIFRYLREHL